MEPENSLYTYTRILRCQKSLDVFSLVVAAN